MGQAIRDLFRLYRVRDWLHFLLLPLATFDARPPLGAALFAAGRGIAMTFAILAFGYLVNSVYDRRMDVDPRKNPLIVPGMGKPRSSLVALPAISLMLALGAPWPAQLAAVSSLAFFYVYSAGPRLKAIPVIGSIANVGLFTPLLFVGMRETSVQPGFLYIVMVCAALVFETQLIHEAADQVEDAAGGIHTTWLTLGARWTALLTALAGLGAAAAAAGMMSGVRSAVVVIIIGAVSGVAFPLLLAWHGADAKQAARLRVTHRWCGTLFGAGLFAAWCWGS